MAKPSDTRMGGETNEQLAGLDYAPTLRWYDAESGRLDQLLRDLLAGTSAEPVLVSDFDNRLALSQTEIDKLWGLYSESARQRAAPTVVKAQPPRWFSRASAPGRPDPTYDESQALFPTAHIPSYTGYEWISEPLTLNSTTIELYQLPAETGFSAAARYIAHVQSLVHEYAHTIIAAEVYPGRGRLYLPDGSLLSVKQFFRRFADLAAQHPPVSHYASAYRNPDNSFRATGETQQAQLQSLKTAINEELAEDIAARLLGFTMLPERSAGGTYQPFADRPDIAQMVDDYLQAQRLD